MQLSPTCLIFWVPGGMENKFSIPEGFSCWGLPLLLCPAHTVLKMSKKTPRAMHFCMDMQQFLPSRLLLERSSPCADLELPLMCWGEVLRSPVGCAGCGGACAECAPRTFLVYSWLEAKHVDRCSSIRSGKAPLQGQAQHCSAISPFPLAHIWGKGGEESSPSSPDNAWVQSGLGFRSSVKSLEDASCRVLLGPLECWALPSCWERLKNHWIFLVLMLNASLPPKAVNVWLLWSRVCPAPAQAESCQQGKQGLVS